MPGKASLGELRECNKQTIVTSIQGLRGNERICAHGKLIQKGGPFLTKWETKWERNMICANFADLYPRPCAVTTSPKLCWPLVLLILLLYSRDAFDTL